jgi:hypothetical protein
MVAVQYISQAMAWTPDAATANSFQGAWRACRIIGPARLVRLLSHCGQAPEGQMYSANRLDGSYWFAETDLLKIRAAAEADLKSQASQGQGVNSTRLGLYLRLRLRSLLAVSRDWTPSFDYYAGLTIPSSGLVTALAGTIKEQPVYSPDFPGEASAREAGLKLEGGFKQYVIRFDFPANKAALKWIGPVKAL